MTRHRQRRLGQGTAVDGIAVRECVPYALDCMKTTVDEVWQVSKDAIRRARQFCLTHYGLVVEKAGVAGLAGLITNGGRLEGKTVAPILCGGNVRVVGHKIGNSCSPLPVFTLTG